ncbi:DoxX family protein [Rhodobacteraceae bacterium CCMM004]|nr:DoxX family protein [Rhodobacteraceae bacterium CCMM004]
MTALIRLHDSLFDAVERHTAWLIPTLARLCFAAVLLFYYWASAATKLGDGVLGLFRFSNGAYIQIFPKTVEAAGYDVSQLGIVHWLVVLAATWGEFLLPLLIVIGLATRLAALGMIGFVVVQSVVDITGHGADAATIGSWFDRLPSALILDQRAFWIFALLVLVIRGAGPISLDRLLADRVGVQRQSHATGG